MSTSVASSGLAASGAGFVHDGPGSGWNDYTGNGHAGNGTLVVTWTSGDVPTYRFGSVALDVNNTGGSVNNAYLFIGVDQGPSFAGGPNSFFSSVNVTRTQLLTFGYSGLQDNSTNPGHDYGYLNASLGATLTYWVSPTDLTVTPSTGLSGDTVTITFSGNNGDIFNDPTFTFGGLAATDITYAGAGAYTCTVPAYTSGPSTVDVVGTIDYGSGSPDVITKTNGFTYLGMMWQITTPLGVFTKSSAGQPSDFIIPFDVFSGGIFYPKGTVYAWVISVLTPTDTGYWLSIDETFAGAAFTVNNQRPKDPRGFTEIVGFATGSTGMMGGFPGPSCVWNNHFVYAKGLYTPATDPPEIRIFDGEFDRPVTTLPNTAAGVVPKGIMSMLTANGQVYLSTYDTGMSSSDFVGRVFSLDIETGQITPVGAPFLTGHIPYALAWHAGRLWCGTHRQDTTAVGKVFYFRPGIDTTWTDDYTLSSSGVKSCTSLLSYKGKLYVGTTNAAGSFAKVLVRSELGIYATSNTGSGGTAADNNAYLALAEFGGNLYASFWNPDGTAVSEVRMFDNMTWTTAYSGSGSTLVPYIGFPTDDGTLLTIGGGVGYSAVLLSTTDGTTWADRSAFLSQGTPASTGIPVFGVVMH